MRPRSALFFFGLTLAVFTPPTPAAADHVASHKIAGGLSVHLGVVQAANISRAHPQYHAEMHMHGGANRGGGVHHVMVAIFDATTDKQIDDAKVEAHVAPLGLGGVSRLLEPMVVADTVSYGNYFTMRDNAAYRIRVAISAASGAQSVRMEFFHDRRTR
jgi:hypothetical protein